MSKRTASSTSSGSDASVENKVSIVVPTYKEAMNIPELCTRVFKALREHNIVGEMVIVDDNSPDDTVEQVKKLQEAKYDIRVIVRTDERGLSSAVLRGFKEAKYGILLVMDADLQHNPKYIPELVGPIIADSADFTIGSRYIAGGSMEGWAAHRKLISWGATLIAKPLVNCSDPMSGFFCLRKTTLKRATVLNPLGYKIALELMVRCNCKKIKEVAISFDPRKEGESKLTMKQNFLYLAHVSNLYLATQPQVVVLVIFVLLALLVVIMRKFV